ncbi:low temperature requirement protein A [Altererythrobacter sp. FM1]|uniref:low temperature requirement protein A n=1 Tax=Tsuneonella flava TaxID=2055955 RepID=UPI000C7FB627|nr:low temperature requirement protein A [Tsuneonella flava]ROT93851.1 low temperature requirement protein A [Altererythrobacter sp. FM1]UBS33015.1 low temperature requirement protein A [Altererythrobacter sp. N1]
MSEVKGRLFDYRPFGPRDPHETHRAATPLELFFDLVTVIAIASAAVGLHHGIAEGHTMQALPVFMVAFFGIWWAWMNYTWFASAYDNDGPIYRLLTFWIMFGFLWLAASVPRFFDGLDITLPVMAYVVMRIGMIALWLIAARNDPSHATTAHRYAAGIAVAQVLWVALAWLLVPGTAVFFAVLALAAVTELMVPVYAERAGMTPWHDDHIVERYGLLMIILLGEILLAGSASLAKGGEEIGLTSPLLHVALASLVIAFAMWWLYFSRDDHLRVHTEHEGLHFQWGYGHLIPFAATAAVGAGFGVLVDIVTGHAHIPLRAGDIAVALPLALYMAGLWFVRDRFVLDGGARAVLPVFAVLVLIAGALMPAALESMAVLSVLAVFVRSVMATRARRRIRAES